MGVFCINFFIKFPVQYYCNPADPGQANEIGESSGTSSDWGDQEAVGLRVLCARSAFGVVCRSMSPM